MAQKYGPSECVADVVASVNDKGDVTIRSLAVHYETSSEWLIDAIRNCKRKILEGTGHEVSEPKRPKPTTLDKENTTLNTENNLSNAEKLKKSVASMRKAPASVKKAPESMGKKDQDYIPVMSLKVADLRNELRKLGLDTSGLKKELQKRLLEALADSVAPRDESKKAASFEVKTESVPSKMPDNDVQMTDMSSSQSTKNAKVEKAPAFNTHASRVDSSSEEQSSARFDQKSISMQTGKEKVVGKSFLKSTADFFSPKKIASKVQSLTHQSDPSESGPEVPKETQRKSSFTEGLKRTASAILSASPSSKAKPAPSVKSPFAKSVSRVEAIPEMKVVSTVEAVGMASSGKEQKSQEIKAKAQINPSPAISIPASTSSTGKPNSAGAATMAKRNQAKKEREARLAEMRGKSKPVTLSKPAGASNDLRGLSASKMLKLGSAKGTKSDRKLLLTAQMREKAAAGYKVQLSSNVPSTTKVNLPQPEETKAPDVARSFPKVTSSPKVIFPPSHQKISSLPTSSAAPKPSKVASVKKPVPLPADILSPMSTYEISDREHSDTDDSDSESEHKMKKALPKWAQKHNLLPALERQYAGNRLDPDTIFAPVKTCNLEAIFDQKKTRYNRRTSSANWAKDGVSANEIVAYKRTMGF